MVTRELAQATHCVNVIVRRIDPVTGKRQLLLIDSTPTNGGPKQTKFPGGTNKGYPGEKKIVTRDRETKEETGLRLLCTNSHSLWSDFAGSIPRHFYVVDEKDVCGELRTESMTEDDGEILSAPYWCDIEKVFNKLFQTHKEPFSQYVRRYGVR